MTYARCIVKAPGVQLIVTMALEHIDFGSLPAAL